MTIIAGTRLGPYEITGSLGAGGMGEVYRARDTRLDRTVALKVVAGLAAASPEMRERFEREAHVLSSLEHPHICPLYDVGTHEGTMFLVMQLLDGETLAARLLRGPLPLAQAITIATEVGDALAAAHRAGINHRDLKPGNIILTKSGAKLLDFGLAKASAPTAMLDATMTQGTPLTGTGVILGTPHYMAPEQLEGHQTDARSDIFAFGCVLYEMITGQRAFDGNTAASVISAILRDHPPPLTELQPVARRALDLLVRTCLAKNPEERWESIADVVRQIRWIPSAPLTASIDVPARRQRTVAAWTTAALALALAAALAAVLLTRTRPENPIRSVLSVLPPRGVTMVDAPAVSPDGRRIAFIARGADGGTRLWVRRLDAAQAQLIDGTDGASLPFWSPDSASIGFFTANRLKRTGADGGAPITLATTGEGAGGTWSTKGTILFAPYVEGPLMQVPADGGLASEATTLDAAQGETHHLNPWFLPDGEHYLLYVASSKRGIYVGRLGNNERQHLLDPNPDAVPGVAATPGVYAAGHLLHLRGRSLIAHPFDADRRALAGDARVLAETVDYDPPRMAAFGASDNGLVVYRDRRVAAASQLVWSDRAGSAIVPVGPAGTYFDSPHPATPSPDGRLIVVERVDDTGTSLWIIDATRGTSTRIAGEGWAGSPAWSPDGRMLAYSLATDSPPNLVVADNAGAGTPVRMLRKVEQQYATGWTPDGRGIIYAAFANRTGWDLKVLPLDGTKPGEPRVVLQTAANESWGRVSSDGNWLAYVSDESGRPEIYVTRFPQVEGKWAISARGGTLPRWRADAKELLFIAPDGAIMSVNVRASAPDFDADAPRALFKADSYRGLYDVLPSAARFLLARAVPSPDVVPLTVLNDALR